TVIAQVPTSDGLSLTRSPGQRFVGEIVFEIVGLGTAPESVFPSAWTWSADRGGTLTVTVSPTDGDVTIVR
ncbi:MAG: hypothetical protein QF464_16295, partial [Myxococcota bacterium]|nr:hypothetical protein [Myxococcota bacterium]